MSPILETYIYENEWEISVPEVTCTENMEQGIYGHQEGVKKLEQPEDAMAKYTYKNC